MVEIVAIGASLGGLHALRKLLGALPADFGSSLVIAQHRSANADSLLVDLLAGVCRLPVSEPEDKDPLQPGNVYVAPSDYHLLVEPGLLSLSVDPPVCFSRPSIDVLFESVADSYGQAALGIILTGASHDGAAGAAAIKAAGGSILVQDPKNAESPIAPRSVIAKVTVDGVLELDELAAQVVKLCRTAGS